MLYFLDVAGIKNIVRDLETMLIVVYAGDNDRVKRSKVFTLGMLLTAEVGLGLTQKYVGRRGVLSFC